MGSHEEAPQHRASVYLLEVLWPPPLTSLPALPLPCRTGGQADRRLLLTPAPPGASSRLLTASCCPASARQLFCCWLSWRSRCQITIVRRSPKEPSPELDLPFTPSAFLCLGGPLCSPQMAPSSILPPVLPSSLLWARLEAEGWGWANDRSGWLWFPVEITPGGSV